MTTLSHLNVSYVTSSRQRQRREFPYNYFEQHGEFTHDNLNSTLKIKHLVSQKIVDKFRALSSKQFLCLHLRFKKVIAKILSVFRPLARHSVLQVNLFI